MKLILLKIKVFFKLLIVTVVFLLLNVSSYSQQSNRNNNIVVGIPSDSTENNVNEQTICLAKYEKISKKMELNHNEEKIIIEVNKSFTEALKCIKDAEAINKEIIAERKQILNSTETQSEKVKAYKQVVKKENKEITLKYDAEELYQIGNNLLFNIYEKHFPSVGVTEANDVKKKQIKDLVTQAKKSFSKAIRILDYDNFDSDYQDELRYLRRASFFQREAINNYEQAYYLYYNFTNIEQKAEELTSNVSLKNDSLNQKIIENNKLAIDSINQYLSEEDKAKNNFLNKKIIFKIQIGAFKEKVNEKEFNGLTPLFEDTKDQEGFTKFMVGKYYSYKAANEAKKIITKTTPYKDAFVVAYKGKNRIELNNELKNKDFN